jgi:hypothetical protein
MISINLSFLIRAGAFPITRNQRGELNGCTMPGANLSFAPLTKCFIIFLISFIIVIGLG